MMFAFRERSTSGCNYFIKRGIIYMKIFSAVPRSDLNSFTQSKIVKNVLNDSLMRKGTFRYVCFVCLFGVFCPIREFLTNMETSPLPMKDDKF